MPIVPIDRTLGTNIGDMTQQGGLAAAFDGVTVTNASNSATSSGSSGFVGKTLAVPRRFARAELHPPSTGPLATQGFVGGTSTVTINIRGKQGITAPTDRTDGIIVGTETFTDVTDMKTITSTDTSTLWDHLFAEFIEAGPGDGVQCAELVFYTPMPSPQAIIIV